MASLVLSTLGNSAFGPVGGFLGALAGSAIDNAAITALTPARAQPSKLSTLKVQASEEGAAIPITYGRFRVTGQVIWTSKFREITQKRTVGGKGGQRVVERTYSISFAIGLCEGPIDGLGKVWVNGELLDLSKVNHRIYLGDETQMPNPLIEALEGLNNAPAFRGLAYVVFEDFALGTYGDRIPQFGFEVFSSADKGNFGAPKLRDLAQAVCLIPGAGEFAYATTPLRKVFDTGFEVGENLHAQAGRSDFDVSLDNLARDFPNVSSVSLVVAWFGTDLRAGVCQILPKVESTTKQTRPRAWSVTGLSRGQAQVVSQVNGKPSYGGSPDDQSVIEGIVALKSRGLKVTHNPFIMMDIPADNSLPNPNGGSSQAPYPWRGRITCFPAIGQGGTVDASAAATTQVNAFFGIANAAHFAVNSTAVTYSGPNEWSYRRFILHQAALTKAAGGVDAFLIGSELIGLTRVRGSGSAFPAVTQLIALAGEVRTMLGPNVKISYGADWTEYGAYTAPGTNDLRFPLDPLWANANIDFIGLDWYAPISDRRDGEARLSHADFKANIEAGEGYDFYYANDNDRIAKTRSTISDGAYQEHWVWRQKDIRGFWSNAHFERVNGVRATVPTAWVPKSKPMALLELGFPAVDKGANRPSVFPDPKSVESGLPPFSNGKRDDGEQRIALEATLSYWQDNNPPSNLYVGNMLDVSRTHLWAWDARPFPHFPALVEDWADGEYAMLGHWLAGRSGSLSLSELVVDLCARGGLLNVDAGAVTGYVEGFAIEAPTSARSALENLFQAFGLEAIEQGGQLTITSTKPPIAIASLGAGQILVDGDSLALARSIAPDAAISAGRLSVYAAEADYQSTTQLTAMTGQNGPINNFAAPLVLDEPERKAIAQKLARQPTLDGLTAALGPALSARLQAGDRIALTDGSVWRVDQLAGQTTMRLQASRAPDEFEAIQTYPAPQAPTKPVILSPPLLVVLDLTAPFVSAKNPSPLVGCATSIWPGDIDVLVGNQAVATVSRSMICGTLPQAVSIGPVGRFIGRPLLIKLKFGAMMPEVGQAALMSGSVVADVISWRRAVRLSADTWQLHDWVRGLAGASEGGILAADTPFIVLDDALVPATLDPSLVGLMLDWHARPQADISLETTVPANFKARGFQPWPPCQVRAKRTGAGIVLSWVRRARGEGDNWASAQPPLGAVAEAYELRVLNNAGVVMRSVSVAAPSYIYTNALELADFTSTQSQLRVEVAQIGDDALMGSPWTGTVSVI